MRKLEQNEINEVVGACIGPIIPVIWPIIKAVIEAGETNDACDSDG